MAFIITFNLMYEFILSDYLERMIILNLSENRGSLSKFSHL